MITNTRLKQLMESAGMPHSRSLMQALKQCDMEAAIAERKACAEVARNGCLVPPDGGEPTENEVMLCDDIAKRIMER